MRTYDTAFTRYAELVQVRDLARPLAPPLQSTDLPRTVLDELERNAKRLAYDPTERWSLVHTSDAVTGVMSFLDIATSEAATIGEVSAPIQPGDMLSGDLDALAVVPLLTGRGSRPFFVLDGSVLVGSLEYSDLFGAPFRLCLFALTLQLEESAARCLLQRAEDAAKSLPEGRREKAHSVCEGRFGARGWERPSNVVRCTTFIDKATMLAKLKMTPISNTRLQDLFVKVENLRNYCAHPSIDVGRSAPILKQEEFAAILTECQEMISILDNVRSGSASGTS